MHEPGTRSAEILCYRATSANDTRATSQSTFPVLFQLLFPPIIPAFTSNCLALPVLVVGAAFEWSGHSTRRLLLKPVFAASMAVRVRNRSG